MLLGVAGIHWVSGQNGSKWGQIWVRFFRINKGFLRILHAKKRVRCPKFLSNAHFLQAGPESRAAGRTRMCWSPRNILFSWQSSFSCNRFMQMLMCRRRFAWNCAGDALKKSPWVIRPDNSIAVFTENLVYTYRYLQNNRGLWHSWAVRNRWFSQRTKRRQIRYCGPATF